jgi:hypothetical protein
VQFAFGDVVDEDIETSVLGADAREDRLDLGGHEMIDAGRDAAAAARGHHRGGLFDGLGPAGVDPGRGMLRGGPAGAVDGGARLAEHARDAASRTTRGAGDEGDAAGERGAVGHGGGS